MCCFKSKNKKHPNKSGKNSAKKILRQHSEFSLSIRKLAEVNKEHQVYISKYKCLGTPIYNLVKKLNSRKKESGCFKILV